MLYENLLFKKAVLLVLALAGISAQAQFNYNNRDLLVCFRGSSSFNFVVDIGPVNNYVAATTVQTLSGTYYSVNELNYAFGNSRDGIFFSASANDNNTNILWMTNARSNPGTQSSAWSYQSYLSQGNTVGKIDNVGNSAADYASLHVNPATNNTVTALLEPASSGFGVGEGSYATLVTSSGNFNAFEGNIENLTAAGFSTGSTAAVSDLYQIIPSGFAGAVAGTKWIGYFTFSPNGTMTFTPVSAAPPSAPVILSFTRTGTTNKVTFTTGSSGTYYLCETNNLTVARTNWPAIKSTPGIGSTTNLVDITTNTPKYYFIKAQ